MQGCKLITVFGGTGFLGSRVVRHLLRDGHRVRIAARHPTSDPELSDSGRAETARADLFKPKTLSAALNGADGVVNATSLYVEKGDLTYHAVHVDAAARLATLANRAGIRSFVQLSGIGSDPDAENSYIRARGRGETAVQAALPSATVIRPAVMFGDSDALLGTIQAVARSLPVYPLFGAGGTLLQPAWAQDVARAIGKLLVSDSGAPCYELVGADTLTYCELVEEVARASGLRTHPIPVPFPIWKRLATIAERLPGAPLTRAQVALMQIDNVASGALPGLADLSITPKGIIGYLHERQESNCQTSKR
ncbi:NAD(P)H azoreductase (plasmid) [Sulfitobacter indolifex]|uniref:complex I NDUFA9 subunit family protein n=1 Tax=Sulfitobacter indolifex TaxID=225422 RepID=UPI001FAC96BC|nr:complex I NDUFA9 subunit family protein [Sulfitobacter indolifex]UOA21321.1 NAD(P)H azoreductase [Sulfitobacter indolifex]